MRCLRKENIVVIICSLIICIAFTIAIINRSQGKEMEAFFPPEEKGMPLEHKDPFDNMMYYRGSRTVTEEGPLLLRKASCDRMDKSKAVLEISFNQEINPLTITPASIYIDEEQLPSSTKFAFNRMGDTLRTVITTQKDTFKLHIEGVESYSGVPMEAVNIQIKITEERW